MWKKGTRIMSVLRVFFVDDVIASCCVFVVAAAAAGSCFRFLPFSQ